MVSIIKSRAFVPVLHCTPLLTHLALLLFLRRSACARYHSRVHRHASFPGVYNAYWDNHEHQGPYCCIFSRLRYFFTHNNLCVWMSKELIVVFNISWLSASYFQFIGGGAAANSLSTGVVEKKKYLAPSAHTHTHMHTPHAAGSLSLSLSLSLSNIHTHTHTHNIDTYTHACMYIISARSSICSKILVAATHKHCLYTKQSMSWDSYFARVQHVYMNARAWLYT